MTPIQEAREAPDRASRDLEIPIPPKGRHRALADAVPSIFRAAQESRAGSWRGVRSGDAPWRLCASVDQLRNLVPWLTAE